MPDEVKLEPCGHCGTKMLRHKHCFSHPYPAQGDCILRHYSFDNNKIAAWNRRAAIEATRPTAATDDVVKELVEAVRVSAQAFRTLEEVAVAQLEHDKARNFIRLGDRCRAALARTGVTLNG